MPFNFTVLFDSALFKTVKKHTNRKLQAHWYGISRLYIMISVHVWIQKLHRTILKMEIQLKGDLKKRGLQ